MMRIGELLFNIGWSGKYSLIMSFEQIPESGVEIKASGGSRFKWKHGKALNSNHTLYA